MTIKTASELATLDYSSNGVPYNVVTAKNLDTTTLDYTNKGVPFYAAGSTYTPPVITYKTSQFFVMF